MRRLFALLTAFCILLMFAGCEASSSNGRSFNSQTNVDDILQSGISQTTGDTEKTANNTAANTAQSVQVADIDLTALSGTMVYSEVYNMMSMPENYIGKTIKMSGIFSTSHDDTTGKDYYACIIQDATACCAQGMEFILTDGFEYPEAGENICVVGVFDTYNEGQFCYCTLRDAILV